MSDIMDYLCRVTQPPAPPAPPARIPAGNVTPVERRELDDPTNAEWLGSLVSSSQVTEQEIDLRVARGLLEQAMQDDIIEDGNRLVGLRRIQTQETRPLAPQRPAPEPVHEPESHPSLGNI